MKIASLWSRGIHTQARRRSQESKPDPSRLPHKSHKLKARTTQKTQNHGRIEMILNIPVFLNIFGFLFAALSFVQVPQWDNDWTKCSVSVPDTACHWYVVNPDNTFGKGFSWITAPEFDVDALRDIGIQHEFTVAKGYQTTVELMNATTEVKYGDNY